MTPAEELTAAADKLDALVAGASDGPWDVGSEKDMLDPGGPSYFLDGVERWRGLTNNVHLGEDEETARYIAAMNPLVGKALAEWLRSEAQAARGGEGRAFGGLDLYRVNPRALALTRLIHGGAS